MQKNESWLKRAGRFVWDNAGFVAARVIGSAMFLVVTLYMFQNVVNVATNLGHNPQQALMTGLSVTAGWAGGALRLLYGRLRGPAWLFVAITALVAVASDVALLLLAATGQDIPLVLPVVAAGAYAVAEVVFMVLQSYRTQDVRMRDLLRPEKPTAPPAPVASPPPPPAPVASPPPPVAVTAEKKEEDAEKKA